jgi:exodeoxyribonuclease-3
MMTSSAAELLALEMPVILAGDYNVMPTELDVYKPARRKGDQCPRLPIMGAGRLP